MKKRMENSYNLICNYNIVCLEVIIGPTLQYY